LKALLLCAGKGTRLRPLTHTAAKHLIPVANKPILFYGLEALADVGVREIGLVVGESHADIEEAVGDGSKWGVRVEYIEQRYPRGLAHAVLMGRKFVGDEPFIVYLGDNLFQTGLRQFTDAVRDGCDAGLMVHKVRDPRGFGVVEADPDGNVLSVVEKPQEPRSDLAITGVYFFTSAVFDAISQIKPSQRNELEITDAIQVLVASGHRVLARKTEGWWKDTGKPEDVLDANRLLLEPIEPSIAGTVERCRIEGRVVVAASACVVESTIRGPVMIGERCRIERSFIGPFTSISDDSKIRDVEIENSIVMAHCKVSNLPGRIDSSLLGRNVVLTRADSRPASHQFILGDESQAFLA